MFDRNLDYHCIIRETLHIGVHDNYEVNFMEEDHETTQNALIIGINNKNCSHAENHSGVAFRMDDTEDFDKGAYEYTLMWVVS